MTYKLVVILAEDPNDAQALEHLLRYLVPGVGKIRKPRAPLVLIKGRPPAAARKSGEQIASAVAREAKSEGRTVELVIAHQDCDDFEPKHEEISRTIEATLRAAGVKNPVAAVPAWEMEAWWYLWPNAVAAVCPAWRRLSRTGAVGAIASAKKMLRRDLRPTTSRRIPDYSESDAPRIAAMVQKLGEPPRLGVTSGSYEAFRRAVIIHRRD